jgi:hypothetical protein
VASDLRLALGRGTLTPLLGLQESADVLGAEPRKLVMVVSYLLVVLDPMDEDCVSVHRFGVPGHHSSPSGRTSRITTGILPIGRCGMFGGCSTLCIGLAHPTSVEQMFGCVQTA